MRTFTQEHWDTRAAALAKIAYTDWLPSRFGHDFFNIEDAVLIFNNWPYQDKPLRRDVQLEAFRSSLAIHGFKELAYKEYPTQGPDDGYTYAIMVKAERDQYELVVALYEEALKAGW